MDTKILIQRYLDEVRFCLDHLDVEMTSSVIDILMKAYHAGRRIYLMGNGGGASTASHMACDLSKGTLEREYEDNEKRFRVHSLVDNASLMTAYANDLSYEEVFVQQLRNHVEKDDVVIAISASGNSPNLIRAIEYAKQCKAITVGFLSFKTGGKLGNMVDYPLIIQSMHYGPSEDVQLVLEHIIVSCVAKIKSGEKGNNKAVPFR
jgi:D-sedoheptulose 7-phosphate isomerase